MRVCIKRNPWVFVGMNLISQTLCEPLWSCLKKLKFHLSKYTNQIMVVKTFNPSSRETEAGGPP